MNLDNRIKYIAKRNARLYIPNIGTIINDQPLASGLLELIKTIINPRITVNIKTSKEFFNNLFILYVLHYPNTSGKLYQVVQLSTPLYYGHIN